MIYLLLGEDCEAKDKKIVDLKNKHLSSTESITFDYEALHGHKLDSDILKKTLISLPTVASQRFILIRQCDKLKAKNKEIILKFVQSKPTHIVLILDSDGPEKKDSFMQSLTPLAKVLNFSTGRKSNVFDMTRAISMRKPKEALKTLSGLLSSGDHPLQIMGGLVWFWGNSRQRVTSLQFKEGLVALQEADLNIKRSRLKPKHALEILVVRLCSL